MQICAVIVGCRPVLGGGIQLDLSVATDAGHAVGTTAQVDLNLPQLVLTQQECHPAQQAQSTQPPSQPLPSSPPSPWR